MHHARISTRNHEVPLLILLVAITYLLPILSYAQSAYGPGITEIGLTTKGYCVYESSGHLQVMDNDKDQVDLVYSMLVHGDYAFDPLKPTEKASCTTESRNKPIYTAPLPTTSTTTNTTIPNNSVSDGSVATDSFLKLPNPLGAVGINTAGDAADRAMTILTIVAVPFVTIMIMYAGFSYVAAYGNPEKIKAANKRLMWTIIGTVLLFGAATIGNVIIKTIQKVSGNETSSSTTSDSSNTTSNNQSGTGGGTLPDPNKPSTGGYDPNTVIDINNSDSSQNTSGSGFDPSIIDDLGN